MITKGKINIRAMTYMMGRFIEFDLSKQDTAVLELILSGLRKIIAKRFVSLFEARCMRCHKECQKHKVENDCHFVLEEGRYKYSLMLEINCTWRLSNMIDEAESIPHFREEIARKTEQISSISLTSFKHEQTIKEQKEQLEKQKEQAQQDHCKILSLETEKEKLQNDVKIVENEKAEIKQKLEEEQTRSKDLEVNNSQDFLRLMAYVYLLEAIFVVHDRLKPQLAVVTGLRSPGWCPYCNQNRTKAF